MVLLDNPGCGEHGSDIIIKNVDKAQMSSAAFVIVTTFQQYRNNACSEALQSIFSQNKGICTCLIFLTLQLSIKYCYFIT